ncbi:symmetrical bis(5'-nucleosyl)-tetraphosphatase [Rhodocyclaceae bacterium SMB388]
MAVYAIGDIQGCYRQFGRLLEKLRFDPVVDRLWLVGDLVNRGPESLQVLRLARELADASTVVLGNHDLYLLMVAAGFSRRGKDDTLARVLEAPDRDELLDWLAHRPLAHAENGFLMVHAGVLPNWSVAQTLALAAEVETALTGPASHAFLLHLQGDKPDRWADTLRGQDRLRFVVNVLTRMRFCTPDGRLAMRAKGPPDKAPPGTLPWFRVPQPAWSGQTIVCGHWSALGYYRRDGLIALDSGCVWGGKLTAVRLEDGAVFQVNA